MKTVIVDKLVEECTQNDDEVKMARITSAEDTSKCKSSCILYIVLIKVIFTINIGIATYSIYYKYMNGNKGTVSRYDYVYQRTI